MNATSPSHETAALRARIVELEKENADNHTVIAEKNNVIAGKDAVIAAKDTIITDKNTVIQEPTEKVELLKAWYFSKRSEKQAKPAREETQYWLFGEAEFQPKKSPNRSLKRFKFRPIRAPRKAASPFRRSILVKRSFTTYPKKKKFAPAVAN